MENEVCYDGTLEGLFALLDRLWREDGADLPRRVRRPPCPFARGPDGPEARDLPFDEGAPGGADGVPADPRRPPPGTIPPLLPDPAALDGAAGILFQVSADAYGAMVHAWMSGLPLEARILRYALKVLAAARAAVLPAGPGGPGDTGPAGGSGGTVDGSGAKPDAAPWYAREEARKGAARAARNRGDDDCGAVLAAAYKAAREIDRLMGFLRFSPDGRGRYIARCAPDHFVLPALAPHFTRRFGAAPWAVIDEKRGLALVRDGRGARIAAAGGGQIWAEAGEAPGLEPRDQDPQGAGPWEGIWQSYHRLINIESRKNLRLQKQFVPLRYREYLPEFRSD